MDVTHAPIWQRLLLRNAKCLSAIAIMVFLYWAAWPPSLSSAEEARLAAGFAFEMTPLPVVDGPEWRTVRSVHPDLERISAWISSVGAAIALADLDHDGLPNDVVYVHTNTDQVIVAPVPDGSGDTLRFEPFVLEPSGIPHDPATTAPMGVIPCDMNEDGLMDILVYYWGRPPVAFLRRDDSVGEPLSSSSFVAREIAPWEERWFTNAATFADVNGNGHLDLVIGNYFRDGARILDSNSDESQEMQNTMSRAANGGRNRILLWTGATSGSEPTVEYHEAEGAMPDFVGYGWTLALAAGDLDGDLLPEIYVANDFGPSYLLHNRSHSGEVRFEVLQGRKGFTTPNSKVLGRDSFKGMGADLGDLTGNGHLDIYVSNIATDFGLHESHFLWAHTGESHLMRDGIAPYVDLSEPLGLSRSGWGWDTKLGDFNNDGTLEAVQATGFVKGKINRWPELHELAMANDALIRHPAIWFCLKPGDDLSGREHNPFFVRSTSRKDGRYFDIAPLIGLGSPMVTRGIAIADTKGNGKLDLAFANQWEPSVFIRNATQEAGSFLGLHLRHPLEPTRSKDVIVVERGHPRGTSTRPAIGAFAAVTTPNGRRAVGQVDGGNGHSGVRSPDLHFGLGDTPADAELHVKLRWRDPSGQVRETALSLTPGWHTVVLGWESADQEDES